MPKKSWIVIRHLESGACDVWDTAKEFNFDYEQVAGPFDKKADATSWITWVGTDGVIEEMDDEDDVATINDDIDIDIDL